MIEPLRIIQLNIWKSRACMEVLINDNDTEQLDILLIQEPPVSFFKTFVQHRAWQIYISTHNGPERDRAVLYINKRFSTSAHQQIQCDSPGITAVKLETPNRPRYNLLRVRAAYWRHPTRCRTGIADRPRSNSVNHKQPPSTEDLRR